MSSPPDRDLVHKATQGDAEAFGAFVRRHQKRVFRLAFHLLGDGAEAEDATQEAFVRAYQALPRFKGESEPFTWLYRIAVNVAIGALRARKSARRAGEDDPRVEALLAERRASAGASPDGAAQDRQEWAVVCEGLDGLPESLRTTIVLVCIDGLSHDDAAAVLGCPAGTVAWRVHEARRKLREFLASRGVDRKGDST